MLTGRLVCWTSVSSYFCRSWLSVGVGAVGCEDVLDSSCVILDVTLKDSKPGTQVVFNPVFSNAIAFHNDHFLRL